MALARALAEPTALEPTVFAEPIRRNWWGPLDGSPPRDFRPEGRPGADALRSDGRHSDARGSDGAEASETARLRARLSFVRAEIAKREAAQALLPGGSLLGAEQLLSRSFRVTTVSFWELLQEKKAEVQRQDDGFVQVVGKTCFVGQDAQVMPAIDITACKKLCRAGSGYGGFVVHGGYAFFRQQSAQECRQSLTSDASCTTYLNSSSEAAALCADLRRLVARRQELRSLLAERDAAREEGAPSQSAAWRTLEAELRRKNAQSLELHRRVHDLEEALQGHIQATDQRVEQVLSALKASAFHLRQ